MARDPIVDEIRRTRDRIAREHGNDLASVFRALQDNQAKSGRPVVSLPAEESPDAARRLGEGLFDR